MTARYYNDETVAPLTTYYYVVYATNGQFNSKASNEVELKTGEPTLNYLKVTALDATNVTGNGFCVYLVLCYQCVYPNIFDEKRLYERFLYIKKIVAFLIEKLE